MSKTLVAKQLGVARSTLYYQSRLAVKDEQLRQDILQVLHLHPSYGYRRLAIPGYQQEAGFTCHAAVRY